MNRTQAFLLPTIPLTLGLPVIDKSGQRGVIVDRWFCEESKCAKVRVCRMRRFQSDAVIETYMSMEVRVDLNSELGFVHALREYLKLVNAEAREEVKAYVWSWGGVYEQVVKWWAAATDEYDEKRLIKKLINVTNTDEN